MLKKYLIFILPAIVFVSLLTVIYVQQKKISQLTPVSTNLDYQQEPNSKTLPDTTNISTEEGTLVEDLRFGYRYYCPTGYQYQLQVKDGNGSSMPYKQEACIKGHDSITLSIYDSRFDHQPDPSLIVREYLSDRYGYYFNVRFTSLDSVSDFSSHFEIFDPTKPGPLQTKIESWGDYQELIKQGIVSLSDPCYGADMDTYNALNTEYQNSWIKTNQVEGASFMITPNYFNWTNDRFLSLKIGCSAVPTTPLRAYPDKLLWITSCSSGAISSDPVEAAMQKAQIEMCQETVSRAMNIYQIPNVAL